MENSPSPSRKRVHEAKKGAKASLVIEPLMPVVRQIANSSNAAAICTQGSDDVMVIWGQGAPDSSSVCIRISHKNLGPTLSTLFAQRRTVDAGTMTDDQLPVTRRVLQCRF